MSSWMSAILTLLCLLPGAASAEGYRIGPGDILSLRVLEWQPLENRTVEWDAMRDTLQVEGDGMVTIPFIGRVAAAGLSPAALSAIISDGLRDQFAVSSLLDAVVRAKTLRPVYVAGAVRAPGEYPFRPGLTAAQLLAMAGGNPLAAGDARNDLREFLARSGLVAELMQESERLQLRRALFEASIAEQETVDLAPRGDGSAWPAHLVEDQNRMLQLGRDRRARELAVLDDQIGLLRNEILVLTKRSEAIEQVLDSARREYENVRDLSQRGLAAGARLAETERSLALAEAQLLDISTAVLRARQGIAVAEAEKQALRDRARIENTRALHEVEAELARVLTRLDTEERLAMVDMVMVESGLGLREIAPEDTRTLPEPVVTILRGHGAEAQRLSGLATVLEPGDVVSVALPRQRLRGGPVGLEGMVTQ